MDGGTVIWARLGRFEEKVMISVLLVHFRLSRSSRSIGMGASA